jgi:hypothetical protein
MGEGKEELYSQITTPPRGEAAEGARVRAPIKHLIS